MRLYMGNTSADTRHQSYSSTRYVFLKEPFRVPFLFLLGRDAAVYC